MKHLSWIAGALLLSVYSSSASATSPMPSPMQQVARSMERSFRLPAGFTKREMAKPQLIGTPFGRRLNELTRLKIRDWRKLVTESGEFDHLTEEKREFALNNPAKYLGVPYLLEVSEVNAVYQEDRLVGYIVEAADHVQAAIYQDGAWINFYLDENFEVVAEFKGAA